MTWFRVDDHLHAHSKTVRAGTEAMGLWVLAGSWSGAEESDGWVPAYMLTRLAGMGASEWAEALVSAGLWHAETVDGVEGFRFHQWEEHQPTREQLVQKRADARDRMRRARERGGSVRANSERSSRAVTPTRPDPTRPITTPPAGAGEFDAFWSAYPRKVGKAAAAKAYAKALRTTDADTIAAGLTNAVAVWAASRSEERFIPHASTWLNAGRWADEQPTLPDTEPTRPQVTLRQCENGCPGTPHRWDDDRNHYHCQGA